MCDTKYNNLEASSLIDLKAELIKKQEAFKQAKLNQSDESLKRKRLKLKGEEVSKKSKNAKKPPPETYKCQEEEEELLKSRLALERKTKLYEKIISQKVTLNDEESETYMVDFHRKIINNNVLYNDKNVESIRTEDNLLKDKNILQKLENSLPSVPKANPYKDFFVHGNINSSTLKSIPDSQNDEINKDGPVHYQNIQFEEVRDHGVGYFAFSKSEEERKAQMDTFNTLRKQTEQKKAAFKTTEGKQNAALQARLAKICARKNIDKSAIDKFIIKSDIDATSNDIMEDVNLSDIPLPEGNPVSIIVPPKAQKIRPWDEGKRIIGGEIIIEKPQKAVKKDYIEERRTERNEEFAPPSLYS